MKIYFKCLLLSIMLLFPVIFLTAREVPLPPGVIIKHQPTKYGKYIGSPSICIMPNGDYLVSHDEFGPNSSQYQSAQTFIYHSVDKGESWEKISQINGQFWGTLFIYKDELYIMGTNKAHGNIVIRKSIDEGLTWTNPYNPEKGLILEGEYHTAPVPVIEHNGRIWRSFEYATSITDKWPERYSAIILSAPIDSNILDAKNWKRSNNLRYEKDYLGGNFQGWLEGNAVGIPNGNVVNILRVSVPEKHEEYIAIVEASPDGQSLSSNVEFVKMPGASKKFTVRYDDKSKKYWTIINNIPEEYKEITIPDRIRNFVSLASSTNLKDWVLHETVLKHSDHKYHGFQYIDWQFEGDDIIFISRTAFDDEYGGARGYHDANFLTFHRVKSFRK